MLQSRCICNKNFVSIANRCHDEAPFEDMGRAFLIQAGKNGIEQLFQFLSAAGNR
jgi:hypothetical protein